MPFTVEQLAERKKGVGKPGPKPIDPLVRFQKFVVDGDCIEPGVNTPCHLWIGATWKGYGRFTWTHGRTVPAHRWLYEKIVGPIPKGLEPDHLCRVRNCVNLSHCELVTRKVNLSRGEGNLDSRKIACKYGHPFNDGNTRKWTLKTGKVMRQCKACHRRRNLESWHRRKKGGSYAVHT